MIWQINIQLYVLPLFLTWASHMAWFLYFWSLAWGIPSNMPQLFDQPCVLLERTGEPEPLVKFFLLHGCAQDLSTDCDVLKQLLFMNDLTATCYKEKKAGRQSQLIPGCGFSMFSLRIPKYPKVLDSPFLSWFIWLKDTSLLNTWSQCLYVSGDHNQPTKTTKVYTIESFPSRSTWRWSPEAFEDASRQKGKLLEGQWGQRRAGGVVQTISSWCSFQVGRWSRFLRVRRSPKQCQWDAACRIYLLQSGWVETEGSAMDTTVHQGSTTSWCCAGMANAYACISRILPIAWVRTSQSQSRCCKGIQQKEKGPNTCEHITVLWRASYTTFCFDIRGPVAVESSWESRRRCLLGLQFTCCLLSNVSPTTLPPQSSLQAVSLSKSFPATGFAALLTSNSGRWKTAYERSDSRSSWESQRPPCRNRWRARWDTNRKQRQKFQSTKGGPRKCWNREECSCFRVKRLQTSDRWWRRGR